MLIIDFEVGNTDIVGDIWSFIVCGLNSLEQILAGPWYKSRLIWSAHHGITFSRASLSICKDASMISFEIVVQELLSQTIVNIFLMRIVLVGFIVTPERI